MDQLVSRIKLLETTAIFLIAVLYCLAPLQKPLADGFHKLEHTILNTNSNHSHDMAHTQDNSHSHEHQFLSFLNDLFQDNSQGNEHPVKQFKLDKHNLQLYVYEYSGLHDTSEINFSYRFGAYLVSLPLVFPPPEYGFL